ncbi:hypothetical protein K432DRAFT_162887 [Lepidopterella palustris CBS 459.81]|uniref:Uncharacterized protein n=1 Tax=Lepidopterella palustris CBS 459.81 TaxID=1314670 RepID=A0A8E2E242_9PEZI|nr:hypothetical protein K432DRAFT_162887 [Lepidopterella palustris CBS 459.81]
MSQNLPEAKLIPLRCDMLGFRGQLTVTYETSSDNILETAKHLINLTANHCIEFTDASGNYIFPTYHTLQPDRWLFVRLLAGVTPTTQVNTEEMNVDKVIEEWGNEVENIEDSGDTTSEGDAEEMDDDETFEMLEEFMDEVDENEIFKELEKHVTNVGKEPGFKDNVKAHATTASIASEFPRLNCTVSPYVAVEILKSVAKNGGKLPIINRDLIKEIEQNWSCCIEHCFPRQTIDLRPRIRVQPEEEWEKSLSKCHPTQEFEPYDPGWEAKWRASLLTRTGNGLDPVPISIPQLANPDWDFKNPLDWPASIVHSVACLSRITKGQHEAVKVAMVEVVQSRQASYGKLKTPEIQPQDLVKLIMKVVETVV